MNRFLTSILLSALLLFFKTTGFCSTFDERLWEKYSAIETESVRNKGSLAGVYLEPHNLGDMTAKTPLSDLRIVTDSKVEVPWQIVQRRPEKREEEIPSRMQNHSRTEKGETWLELMVEKQGINVNAVEIVTPDSDFSRQIQVLGSNDGKNWNAIRTDGVIFDITRGEKLRHTRISFPQTNFRRLALKIANGNAQPLKINAVKVLQEGESKGQTYTISGTTEKPDINASRQESSIVVRMNSIFPIDRLAITSAERNFQRSVEVQIKRGTGGWEHWTQGTIFNFDTLTMHESHLTIDVPEVATKEFRLVFKNFDSPPLSVTSVTGEGYRRLLVFKQQPDQKLFLFWGNPLAQKPQFDLAEIIVKQKIDELPIAYLGNARLNTKFAGNNARLPFTERYKYMLYIVVVLGIGGLVYLQYRVFSRVES